MKNEFNLDSLCAALAYAMGIPAPELAADADPRLCAYIDEKLGGKKVDRIFMYNPDAIAQWITEKYPKFFVGAAENCELKLPYCAVMPSVTPSASALCTRAHSPPSTAFKAMQSPSSRSTAFSTP